MTKPLDRYQFIWKSIQKHGYKNDYREVSYKTSLDEVCIICPIHGRFYQKPKYHLKGNDCPKCSHRSTKYSKEEILEKLKEKHGNNLDYSYINFDEYKNNRSKILLKCNKCGQFFYQSISNSFRYDCPKCKATQFEEFEKKANEIHNHKYIYHKADFINGKNKTRITCPIHGDFWQRADSHLEGIGCIKCSISKLERSVEILLTKNKINYISQADKNQFKWLNRMRLDFYLTDYNIAIECQGRQHFESIDYFGGDEKLIYTQNQDILKNKLCKENNVPILYYTKCKNINEYTLGKLIFNEEDLLKEIKSYGNN